jgi:hypothetical protein
MKNLDLKWKRDGEKHLKKGGNYPLYRIEVFHTVQRFGHKKKATRKPPF